MPFLFWLGCLSLSALVLWYCNYLASMNTNTNSDSSYSRLQ